MSWDGSMAKILRWSIGLRSEERPKPPACCECRNLGQWDNVHGGGAMPLYACFIQEGGLTRAQKAEIAGEISRIHCDLTGAPPSFVHVRFHTTAAGDGYTGGKPAKSAVLDGTVR